MLSALALMRVFSHLHILDPSIDLNALLEPVDEEHFKAAAEAVKDRVEALLEKFLAIDPVPLTNSAADPRPQPTARATATLLMGRRSLTTAPKAEEEACRWTVVLLPVFTFLQYATCLVEASKLLFGV